MREPARPRAHRQHDGVALDRLTVRGDDSGCRAVAARDVLDDGDPQLRPAALRGVEQRRGEARGCHLCRGLGGAEHRRDDP